VQVFALRIVFSDIFNGLGAKAAFESEPAFAGGTSGGFTTSSFGESCGAGRGFALAAFGSFAFGLSGGFFGRPLVLFVLSVEPSLFFLGKFYRPRVVLGCA
jgi:hypothetical protein